MNKKTLIQLVVIIVAFGGAGMVLYNGLYKNNSTTNATEEFAIPPTSEQSILPLGGTMDFKILDKYNLKYNQSNYPKLDPNSEYGIPVDNLILSPSSK